MTLLTLQASHSGSIKAILHVRNGHDAANEETFPVCPEARFFRVKHLVVFVAIVQRPKPLPRAISMGKFLKQTKTLEAHRQEARRLTKWSFNAFSNPSAWVITTSGISNIVAQA